MFTALWLALLTQPAVVERATIFPLEGNPTTALFSFERTITPTALGHVVEVWFRGPRGQVAVYEKVTYENDAVLRYESVQHQIGERYVLNVMGDQAVLETEQKDRMTRSAHEWTDDTLTMDVPHPVPWTHICAMPPGVAHTPRAPRSAFDTQASQGARSGCTAPRSRPRRRGRPRGSERFGRGSLAP